MTTSTTAAGARQSLPGRRERLVWPPMRTGAPRQCGRQVRPRRTAPGGHALPPGRYGVQLRRDADLRGRVPEAVPARAGRPKPRRGGRAETGAEGPDKGEHTEDHVRREEREGALGAQGQGAVSYGRHHAGCYYFRLGNVISPFLHEGSNTETVELRSSIVDNGRDGKDQGGDA